jgi:23S rRNA pseudouridine1911/1915/1917 synthase
MQAKGHPLIGDPLYGAQKTLQLSRLGRLPEGMEKKYIMDFPRQALHAHHLIFIHPRTDESMTFTAPIADDLKNLIDIIE